MLWPCSITIIHIIHVFKDIKVIYFFMNINENYKSQRNNEKMNWYTYRMTCIGLFLLVLYFLCIEYDPVNQLIPISVL